MSADRVRPGELLAPGVRAFALLRRGEDVDVYDAWSDDRDCRVVVKTLRPDRRSDRGARRRLLAEGRLLTSLTHPHLVRAYEVVERPTPTVVLEMLSGDTLGYLIGDDGPRLPTYEICAMGIQVCSAVGYLHRQGLLHLDLKPSNVICHVDQAKLLDLGIARPPGRGSAGVGTLAFMAPEQVRGVALGPQTDVWGMGALLYTAATRVEPFGPDGVGTGTDAARPVRSLRRLPAVLADRIDSCLAIDPHERPTLAQLATSLRSAIRL